MRIRLVILLPLLVILPRASAQTATTSAPASAPAAGYSTPNAASVAFYTAVRAADVKAMHAAVAPDKALEGVLDPLFQLSAASARLQAAMEKRFTPEGLARAKVSDFRPPEAILKEAGEAKATIDGDTATMTLRTSTAADRPFQTITLKRIGDAWKIDAAKTMRLEPAQIDDVKKMLPTIESSMQAIDAVCKDVEAGKYASPIAAQRVLQEKLTVIAKTARDALPATSPATKP